jgi:hypothetical protein
MVKTVMATQTWAADEGTKFTELRLTVERYTDKDIAGYGFNGPGGIKRSHYCVDKNGNRFLVPSTTKHYVDGETFVATFKVWKNSVIRNQKISIAGRARIFTKDEMMKKNVKRWKKMK